MRCPGRRTLEEGPGGWHLRGSREELRWGRGGPHQAPDSGLRASKRAAPQPVNYLKVCSQAGPRSEGDL